MTRKFAFLFEFYFQDPAKFDLNKRIYFWILLSRYNSCFYRKKVVQNHITYYSDSIMWEIRLYRIIIWCIHNYSKLLCLHTSWSWTVHESQSELNASNWWLLFKLNENRYMPENVKYWDSMLTCWIGKQSQNSFFVFKKRQHLFFNLLDR